MGTPLKNPGYVRLSLLAWALGVGINHGPSVGMRVPQQFMFGKLHKLTC